jgi:hypothetical protein
VSFSLLGSTVDAQARARSSAASDWRTRGASETVTSTICSGASHTGNQPRRVLDVHREEALERAQHGAVQHHRAVGGVVGADVLEVEALGEVGVDLERAELPRAADGVGDVELQLRAVERPLALGDLEGAALGVTASPRIFSARSHDSTVPR